MSTLRLWRNEVGDIIEGKKACGKSFELTFGTALEDLTEVKEVVGGCALVHASIATFEYQLRRRRTMLQLTWNLVGLSQRRVAARGVVQTSRHLGTLRRFFAARGVVPTAPDDG